MTNDVDFLITASTGVSQLVEFLGDTDEGLERNGAVLPEQVVCSNEQHYCIVLILAMEVVKYITHSTTTEVDDVDV